MTGQSEQPADWRPIIAVLANDTARRVVAELVLAEEGGRNAASLPSLRDVSPSRARHIRSALLKSGIAIKDEHSDLVLNASVFQQALTAGGGRPRSEGVERFLTADGAIRVYPSNLAERGRLLALVAERALDQGEVLNEAEVNERLRHYTPDVAVLRRYLVDYGLLERTRSGSQYARTAPQE